MEMRQTDKQDAAPTLGAPIRKPEPPVKPDRVIDAKEGVFQDAQGRMYTAKPTNEAATTSAPSIWDFWSRAKRLDLDLS